MNVQQLRDELQKLIDQGHGELPVCENPFSEYTTLEEFDTVSLQTDIQVRSPVTGKEYKRKPFIWIY